MNTTPVTGSKGASVATLLPPELQLKLQQAKHAIAVLDFEVDKTANVAFRHQERGDAKKLELAKHQPGTADFVRIESEMNGHYREAEKFDNWQRSLTYELLQNIEPAARQAASPNVPW